MTTQGPGQKAGVERRHRCGSVPGAVLFCLSVVVLATVAASPALADQSDSGGPPTLTGGERYNVTAMQVTVADDADVDESSIGAADFETSHGEIRRALVNESGTDATVRLLLADRLNRDEITVSLAEDASIRDESGNELTNGSVTVTGMDSYVPQLNRFAVERVDDSRGRIVVAAYEPLAAVNVTVRGPANATLTEDDFERVGDAPLDDTYAADHPFDETGVYEVELVAITDRGGNRVNFSEARTFARDATAPDPAIDGPRHLRTGDLGRFDAGSTTDDVGVAAYHWSVDGTATAEGRVLERGFDEPGTHDVAVTAVDDRGNAATANWTVTVHPGPSTAGVTVTDLNGSRVRATLDANRSTGRVRLADAYGRLVSADGVALRSLTVTHPANESAATNVSADPAAPAFENVTGRRALAAFTVAPGDEAFADPTFRFAVPADRLSAEGLSYRDVALYRDDGNWTELDTRVVHATADGVVYEATAPGLSTFVVGARADGTGGGQTRPDDAAADVRVTEAALQTEAVAYGDLAVVEATLTNDGEAAGTTVVGLTVGSAVVATRPVTVPRGESRTVAMTAPATRNGTVAVNGTLAGTLVVLDGERGGASTPGTDAEAERSGGVLDAVSVPDPLALWPGGTLGAVLTWAVALVTVTYAILKALAIYLGY